MMDTDFGLYVIITRPRARYVDIARSCVRHGIRYLQLREKDLDDRSLIEVGRILRRETLGTPTRLIINDRVDLAILLEADGLHLGQSDFSPEDIRSLWPEDRILGLSTHNIDQLKIAQGFKPTYIGFGPIFSTPTKIKPDPVTGLELLSEALKVRSVPHIPVVAIGGLSSSHFPALAQLGVSNFSMVRPLMQSADFEMTLSEILSDWKCRGLSPG